MDSLKFTDISPFVRYVRLQRTFHYNKFVCPLDNRLFYCLGGKGIIIIGEKEYEITEGTAIMWRSGIKYRYIPDIDEPYYFYGVNFDMTFDYNEKSAPINPIAAVDFTQNQKIEQVKINDVECLNNIIYRREAKHLKPMFERLEIEFRLKKLFYNKKCSAITTEILTDLVRGVFASDSNGNCDIDIILAYIESHCTENLSNQTVGKHFNYHPNYINKLVVRHTGYSLHGYLLRCRIRKAVDLLNESDLSISEAAGKCGFSSIPYFSRYFKKIMGTSPKNFKNKQR